MNNVIRGVLLLAVVAMSSGCLKFKQVWTVNPDGSGKMQLTMAISEQMLAMAGPAEDPFAEFSPEQMIKEEKNGWVAFSRPVIENVNGFKTATFTGYFEDINAVKFSSSEGDEAQAEQQMQASSYRLDGDTFTVVNAPMAQMLKSMTEDESMKDPQMKAMMAPMMAGLEISETYILPGEVATAEGFQTQGSQASATLTDKDILAQEPPKVAGMEDGNLTITFQPAGWDGKEDAWKKELQGAKAEWAQIKEEAAAGAGAPQ